MQNYIPHTYMYDFRSLLYIHTCIIFVVSYVYVHLFSHFTHLRRNFWSSAFLLNQAELPKSCQSYAIYVYMYTYVIYNSPANICVVLIITSVYFFCYCYWMSNLNICEKFLSLLVCL